MKLDLSKPFDRNKFKTYSEKLLSEEKKIELIAVQKIRTLRQNRYMHVLFSLYAIEFGEKVEHVKQVVFKMVVNKEIFHQQFVEESTGELLDYWRSTASLEINETTLVIDRLRNYSAEHGCYLPTPDEYIENSFHIDKEIEKVKEFI